MGTHHWHHSLSAAGTSCCTSLSSTSSPSDLDLRVSWSPYVDLNLVWCCIAILWVPFLDRFSLQLVLVDDSCDPRTYCGHGNALLWEWDPKLSYACSSPSTINVHSFSSQGLLLAAKTTTWQQKQLHAHPVILVPCLCAIWRYNAEWDHPAADALVWCSMKMIANLLCRRCVSCENWRLRYRYKSRVWDGGTEAIRYRTHM